MTHVFHRQVNAKIEKAVGGEGVYLIDAEGKRYLDGSGGAAVSCLGHGDPDVIAAIQNQAKQLAFAHTGFFTSEPAEELADLMVDMAPDGIEKAYFLSGGSEAVETAIKMARQYFTIIGKPERHHFIARHNSYHGNTLGALAIGGHKERREPYLPLLMETHHISPCYAYRGLRPDESEFNYGQRVANELEEKILELGANTVAAFMAETVVGASLGAAPAVAGYFKRIREICDTYGVLLILDEVMCGMGRTGTTFASEQEGINPDMVCVAKGLGAGYQPIGAVLVSERIFSAFQEGPGSFQHGHTYIGHPIACAAALAVQRAIISRNLMDKVRSKSDVLEKALTKRFGSHHYVGDIRGRGLFFGLEIVADRASKEPFDPAMELPARIKKEAFDRGLICYPDGGTVDGYRGAHILLAPPFIINDGEIDELVSKLGDAIDAATPVLN